MSGDLARALETARLMREKIDQSFAEMLQIDSGQHDPGPLTLEKLERACGIFRKPKHKFRFAEYGLKLLPPFANYITNFGA